MCCFRFHVFFRSVLASLFSKLHGKCEAILNAKTLNLKNNLLMYRFSTTVKNTQNNFSSQNLCRFVECNFFFTNAGENESFSSSFSTSCRKIYYGTKMRIIQMLKMVFTFEKYMQFNFFPQNIS